MTNTVSRTISDATLSRIVQIESAGNPRARAATSSALGLAQFLNATWVATVQQHRPDLMAGRSREQVLALRNDPSLSIEMLARFTEANAKVLGANYTDGDLYLAHFSGAGVARKLLRSSPAASCATCYSPEAIAANRSILEGRTVGQVRAWAERKMAAAAGHDWVGKYYKPHAAPMAPPPDDEEAPVKVERPDRPAPMRQSTIGNGAIVTGGALTTGTGAVIAEKVIDKASDRASNVADQVLDRATDVVFSWPMIVALVCFALALGTCAFIWWKRYRLKQDAGV